MKIYPQIGSRYNGPPLDRPCLRRMPSDWQLHLPEDEQPQAMRWLYTAAVVLAALLVLATVFLGAK